MMAAELKREIVLLMVRWQGRTDWQPQAWPGKQGGEAGADHRQDVAKANV